MDVKNMSVPQLRSFLKTRGFMRPYLQGWVSSGEIQRACQNLDYMVKLQEIVIRRIAESRTV